MVARSSKPSRKLSAVRMLVPGFLFVVCFAVGVQIAARIDRLPELPSIGASLRYLEKQGGGYDLLFFGSSLFLRGIDVDQFDRKMATAGAPVHSFSMSHQGLIGYELDALIRRTFATTKTRPRWVVIELTVPRPEFRKFNRWTARTVYWHTPEVGFAVLHDTLTHPDLSITARVDLGWTHLRHLAQNLLSVGQGVVMLQRNAEPAAEAMNMHLERLARTRGYLPFSEGLLPVAQRNSRERFIRQYDEFRAGLADLAERNARLIRPRPAVAEHFRAQVQSIRAYGALPIYVLMPTDGHESALQRSIHRQGEIPELLTFDNPTRFPELYERASRHDFHHLNRKGARAMANALAERMAPVVRETRAAKNEVATQ